MNLGSHDFDEEMRQYVVEYPYVSAHPKENPDGNPVLYLGLFLAGKRQFFPLDDMDSLLVRATYKDVMIRPGLISRSRFKMKDPEAFDDYVGLASAAYFAAPEISAEIAGYGEAHAWSFNNTGATGTASWRFTFWRMPGFVAHLKLAAKKPLSLLEQLSWAASLVHLSAPTGSGLQMEWLRVDLYRAQAQKYWILDRAASAWEKGRYSDKNYPNLMGSVFGQYFGTTHILAKWLKGVLFGPNQISSN